MYLNKLEAFVNVVKYKSFSKAAKVMFLSQPSVSTYVKSLESDLNVKLLNRNAYDITPTEAGRVLYKYAVEIMQLCDISKRATQNFSHEACGDVSISACPLFSQPLLSEILGSFAKKYPNITCHVTQAEDKLMLQNLEDFKTDFGFSDTPSQSNKLLCEPFYSDPIVLVTPNTADYPYASGQFPVEKLRSTPLIISSECESVHTATLKFMESYGIMENDLSILMQLPSNASILHVVSMGIGVAFISKYSAMQSAQYGHVKLFEFDSPVLKRTLYLISRVGGIQSNVTSLLTDFIHSCYQTDSSDNAVL